VYFNNPIVVGIGNYHKILRMQKGERDVDGIVSDKFARCYIRVTFENIIFRISYIIGPEWFRQYESRP
jgi:hypothetical protein